jgi:hypothetical protein
LNMALFHNIKQSEMVDKIIIFTDMQFNAAIGEYGALWNNTQVTNWDTTYDHIVKLYEKANYKIPQIIFWNLRQSNTNSFPIIESQKGVALISGFSSLLLKLFMNNNEITPTTILSKSIKDYHVTLVNCDLDKMPLHEDAKKLIEISKCLNIKNKKIINQLN